MIKTSDGDDNARLSFGGMGKTTGVFEFESFSLRAAGVDGTLTRNADGGIPMLRKRSLASFSEKKQLDWQEFILDTESAYWNGMRDFLKMELGLKAPILGTQGFWSPSHVQVGMSLIDSHAYWHHPDFQGRGWNADVWTVKNESMAGAPDGGELARLAAQRVKGRPFICTEYNHPAPNTYSAETFPLILSFAAAQDWDGIFAFSYSHRGDEWEQPYFNNFFDIDRHTAKMATLPSAVSSFRRGEIAPLTGETLSQINIPETIKGVLRGGPGFMRQRPEFKETDLFTTQFAIAPAWLETKVTTSKPKPDWQPQLVWNKDARFASVDAPKTKLLVGAVKTGTETTLGDVKITAGESRQGWRCLQLSVIEGNDFATAKRILITSTGDTENTGQQWKGTDKTSVGRNWGKSPVLVEAPSAEIQLPGTGKLRAWALDETGNRRVEIPVTENRVSIGSQHKSVWFEVARE